MKIQVFFVLALVALALAKKEKAKKEKTEEPKPAEVPKPEEDLKTMEDKIVEVISNRPDDGKLSVMDWESAYGSSPVEVLRSLRLRDTMPYQYDSGFYPGYYNTYPRIFGYPYRRLMYNPEQYYNRLGYYPYA